MALIPQPAAIGSSPEITRIWPFKQRGAFIDSLQWQTDVIKAKAAEQRIALRARPRRVLNYDFLMTDYQVASADSLINAADIFEVPDWGQSAPVTSASGTTVIADVSNLNIAIGDKVILWESDVVYESLTVSNIVGSTITVDSTIILSYTDAIIMPLLDSKMPDGFSVSRIGSDLSNVSANFVVFSGTDIGATTYSTYQGHDLMDDDRVLGGGSLEETTGWELNSFDNGIGTPKHIRTRDYVQRRFTMRWMLFTKAEMLTLRKWLHSRRGKQKVFWASTKAKDLEPASAASGTGLTVFDHTGANTLDRVGEFDIQIEDVNGTLYNRRVTAYTTGIAVDGRYTVDMTLDAVTTIAQADIVRISYLRLCRLDTDRIEFSYAAGGHVSVAVPIVEVPAP